MRGSLATLVMAMTVLVVGCSGISQVFEPLPPASTLNFQATLVPGDTIGGTRTVRLSWTPPDESIDLIVLEESREGPNGPWTEFKTLVPIRSFHLESAIYRPGRVFYFRAIIVRGNEESAPTEPVRLWVPYQPQRPTNTPLPAYPPTPTSTPDPVEPTPTPEPEATAAPDTGTTPEPDQTPAASAPDGTPVAPIATPTPDIDDMTQPAGSTDNSTSGAPPGATGGPAQEAPRPLAPRFALETLDGDLVSLADFEGKPLVVNFWGSWCPPCRLEMPLLIEAFRKHGPDDIAFVGIDVQDTEAGARAFLAEFAVPVEDGFVILVDTPDLATSRDYGVRGMPTTFFIDSDHRIARQWAGAVDRETLAAFIGLIEPERSTGPTPTPTQIAPATPGPPPTPTSTPAPPRTIIPTPTAIPTSTPTPTPDPA